MQNQKIQALSLTVIKLLHRNAFVPLKKILQKRHPVEIAYFFRDLTPVDSKKLFEIIDNHKIQSEILAELDMRDQVKLIESINPDTAIKIFNIMDHDDLTDLMEELDEDSREKFLQLMHEDIQETVEELMAYDSNTAGGIMNPSFLALSPEITATEAIKYLRNPTEEYATTFYIYVTNSVDQLTGVISLRQLVTCKKDTLLKDLMTPEVISVPISIDQEEVAEIVEKYGFLAIPVVDTDNRMVGVITVDDVIDVIREEATEDIFKMAGAGEDILYFGATLFQAIKPRIAGLILPLVGGLLATLMLAFQGNLFFRSGFLFLVMLPVIILLSQNIATQSSALIVRGFAMGRINESQYNSVIGRELFSGMFMGLVFGIIISAISFLPVFYDFTFIQNWKISAILGIITFVALSLSAFIASFLPVFYKKLQLDPASVAGGTVLAIVDILVIGIIILGNVITVKFLI